MCEWRGENKSYNQLSSEQVINCQVLHIVWSLVKVDDSLEQKDYNIIRPPDSETYVWLEL